MTKMVMHYPPPEVTGDRCQLCEGLGVTGQQYQMQTGLGRVLLVDVFCPKCGGCGSADPEHRSCKPEAHADPEELGLAAELDDWYDEVFAWPDCCPSCLGRTWIAILGFDGAAQEGRDDGKVLNLRVPCGCTSGQLQEVTD
ncbi:MAG TPA: hypothetical protein VGJ54_11165 [Streptosporangiaceae bacterium]